jgi:hypothetical protein
MAGMHRKTNRIKAEANHNRMRDRLRSPTNVHRLATRGGSTTPSHSCGGLPGNADHRKNPTRRSLESLP